MALPAPFSLLHSELNDFLFAVLGREESGTPLIAVFPEEHRTLAQVRDIAVRLAALLPQPLPAAPDAAADLGIRRRGWPLFWLACLVASLVLVAMM